MPYKKFYRRSYRRPYRRYRKKRGFFGNASKTFKYGFKTLKSAGILSNKLRPESKYIDYTRTPALIGFSAPHVLALNVFPKGTASYQRIGDHQVNKTLTIYTRWNATASAITDCEEYIIYSRDHSTTPTLALLFSDPTQPWISPRNKQYSGWYKIISAKHIKMDPSIKQGTQLDTFKKLHSTTTYDPDTNTIKSGFYWFMALSSYDDANKPYFSYNIRYSILDP